MIKKIVNLNKLGYSIYEIMNFLNRKGFKTKRGGKKFYYNTVKSILSNQLS